jgi:plastocyanin domain-containing protein
MNTLLVNAGGLVLMAAIVWWFWLSPSTGSESNHDHSHHH